MLGLVSAINGVALGQNNMYIHIYMCCILIEVCTNHNILRLLVVDRVYYIAVQNTILNCRLYYLRSGSLK
jgi:hypothetical protein